jgi:hypothetical protein
MECSWIVVIGIVALAVVVLSIYSREATLLEKNPEQYKLLKEERAKEKERKAAALGTGLKLLGWLLNRK